jgi:glycosyltransferase involved in cell wall biosynthesis
MAKLETTLHMTIAYFIASPTWGGGEQYVFDLARHMKDRFGVRTCFLFPPHSNREMTARFAMLGECVVFRYVGKGWRFLPCSGRRLEKILYRWQVDILHINSRQSYFAAVWAKRMARHPFRLIATQHLVRPAKRGCIWEWVYRQIDVLDCVSQCVRQAYLQRLEGRCAFPNVQVVHNSSPIQMEDTDRPKQPPMNHILYHGRICREKGIEPLFEALGLLEDVPFRITFSGNIGKHEQMLWEHLVSTSPVRERIQYVGFQSDMRSLLCECHIGISPSIVPEAGPLSMFEDMAFGLAAITSDNGSQPEIIQDGRNGLLCPPNDPQAIAKALRRLLTDAELTQRLGRQAKQDFFARHTYEHFIQKMYDLYTL